MIVLLPMKGGYAQPEANCQFLRPYHWLPISPLFILPILLCSLWAGLLSPRAHDSHGRSASSLEGPRGAGFGSTRQALGALHGPGDLCPSGSGVNLTLHRHRREFCRTG